MDNYLLNKLKEERKSYAEMVEFCTDNLILNNYILQELTAKDFYFELYCGEDYDAESDDWADIFQYFIIDSTGAERFAEYTNEIVYYCEELELYILGVTHLGTGWDYVPASWKEGE